MSSILLNTRINRGNRDRRIDLCIKECLGSKTDPQVVKLGEKMTLSKIEPSITQLVILNSCFFSNQSH